MKFKNLTYLFLFFTLILAACSSEDEGTYLPFLPGDETWVEKDIDGSSVTIKPFLPGDAVSRSSFEFDGQNLVFGWKQGDKVGIYPTATTEEDGNIILDHTNYPHSGYTDDNHIYRINPQKSSQTLFNVEPSEGNQTVRIVSNEGVSFNWDDISRWSAYFPYSNVNSEEETYENRRYSFENQTQKGLPNMTAYYNGTSGHSAGSSNPDYRSSEASACKHLGDNDVMISPEMSWGGSRINFQLRHLGSVIRLFLFAPEEDLVITSIKLICDSKIFYEKGQFSLKSHPYVSNALDGNFGVNLTTGNADCQIQPVGDPTNMIELKFEGETAKTYKATSLQRYLIAYMMTYPITYNPTTHGNLFAYVTAYRQGDADKKEYNFVTNSLTGKEMKAGYYYQWTEVTHPQDGLYPIELTATLLPWQDIVGAGINTDLEK